MPGEIRGVRGQRERNQQRALRELPHRWGISRLSVDACMRRTTTLDGSIRSCPVRIASVVLSVFVGIVIATSVLSIPRAAPLARANVQEGNHEHDESRGLPWR